VCSTSERGDSYINTSSRIKMVLGLDCFGYMARKASKLSTEQEVGTKVKQKDVAEEASLKAAEKKAEKSKKGKDTGAPLVVPHFPQRSTPGLL
jgi:type IV secretory pathway VirJ component